MSILSHYYQTELAYYREFLRDYARQFPELAGMVLEGKDAAIERLVQGASLVTARLRHRTEDDFPEVVGPLFDQLWPQHMRPLPATTLLACSTIEGGRLRSESTSTRLAPLQGGAAVKGRAVTAEGQPVLCTFRTTRPIELLPLTIEEVMLEHPRPAQWLLCFRMRLSSWRSFDAVRPRQLSIHLIGDEATRLTVHLWLAWHAVGVSIRRAGASPCLRLPRTAIRSIGFDPGETLFPSSSALFPRLQLLQEYFHFIDKFIGVNVTGLDQTPSGAIRDTFDLCFHLPRLVDVDGRVTDRAPALDMIQAKLNCVPAINVSETQQVEIPVKPNAHVMPLQAQGAEIYSVGSVRGFTPDTHKWTDYEPLFGPRNYLGRASRPCYHLLRRADGVQGICCELVITDSQGRPLPPPTTRLQATITYTDGELPLRLGVGQINVATGSSPGHVELRNVTPVAPPSPLKLGREHHWQLLALFNMHPQDLASVNGLSQLIRRARGSRSARQEHRIQGTRSQFGRRLHGQTVVPVREVEIAVDQESFSCQGELFVFAETLRRLFASTHSDQVFHQVTVRALPSGITYRFAPHK